MVENYTQMRMRVNRHLSLIPVKQDSRLTIVFYAIIRIWTLIVKIADTFFHYSLIFIYPIIK